MPWKETTAMEQKIEFIYYDGNKADKYSLFDYGSKGNLIEIKDFKNQKLIRKTV